MSERERNYQADYYQRVTKAKRRGRWDTDTEYKEKEQERARRRRALERANTADKRFDEMIAMKKARAQARLVERGFKHGPTLAPRDVWIDGVPVRCYSSGSLAREIGREARTIRLWLSESVLPGATAFFAPTTRSDAYFSVNYCAAIKRACRRLYHLDARFPRAKLRGLVLEELALVGESYIPVGGADKDRVWLGNRKVS